MNKIKTYGRKDIEFTRLELFAKLANESLKDYFIRIENIYFDFGQDWLYTAPVTVKKYISGTPSITDSWQTLCPRDYEAIINCDSIATITEYATKYADVLNSDSRISVTLSF